MDPQTLVAALLERQMTQTAIAEACGCSQATISDIHRGVIKRPSWEIVDALRELVKPRRRHDLKAPKPAAISAKRTVKES